MLTIAMQSKSKMEKYKKDFFNTICCLVGLEIGDSPTTNINDMHQRCMTIYGKLLESNGAALLANTIGIFVHLPGTTFPKDIYTEFHYQGIQLGDQKCIQGSKSCDIRGRNFCPHERKNRLGNVPRHEKDSK